MAQAVRENGKHFSVPPGLEAPKPSEANASGEIAEVAACSSASMPEHQALLSEVRRQVLDDIDSKVGDKMKDLWSKGNKMLKQAELERQQKNTEFLAELARCREKQDALQAENDQLRATIAGVVQHLSMLGAIISGPKAGPGAACGLAAAAGTNGALTADTANHSSSASASSLQDSPSAFSAPGLDGASFPPLPSVPDFPYSPAPTTSTPVPAAATPLSLAEALGSESPASVPVSLIGSLPNAGQRIFSFTLRKADGTDLGLNVSHHEEDKVLRVESVRPEGAVEAWNRQCLGSAAAEKAVMPGDRIVSVNAVSNDPLQMLEECRLRQLLKITVVRGEAPKSTTLRADASEFVPGGVIQEEETKDEAADS